jgi:hypothetical protein
LLVQKKIHSKENIQNDEETKLFFYFEYAFSTVGYRAKDFLALSATALKIL